MRVNFQQVGEIEIDRQRWTGMAKEGANTEAHFLKTIGETPTRP